MRNARIEFRVGDEAFAKLEALITGDDNDILLAIENLLKEKAGTITAGDPYTDSHGIFVDSLEADDLEDRVPCSCGFAWADAPGHDNDLHQKAVQLNEALELTREET